MKKYLITAVVAAGLSSVSFAQDDDTFAGDIGLGFMGDGGGVNMAYIYTHIGYPVEVNNSVTVSPELRLGTAVHPGTNDVLEKVRLSDFGVAVKAGYQMADDLQIFSRVTYSVFQATEAVGLDDNNNPYVVYGDGSFNTLGLALGVQVGSFNVAYTIYDNQDGGSDVLGGSLGFHYSF